MPAAVSYTGMVRTLRSLVRFWLRNDGQDLADYCLLTALIALIAAAIFIHMTGGIQNLWNIGNSALVSGHSVAGGAAGGANGGSGSTK